MEQLLGQMWWCCMSGGWNYCWKVRCDDTVCQEDEMIIVRLDVLMLFVWRMEWLFNIWCVDALCQEDRMIIGRTNVLMLFSEEWNDCWKVKCFDVFSQEDGTIIWRSGMVKIPLDLFYFGVCHGMECLVNLCIS